MSRMYLLVVAIVALTVGNIEPGYHNRANIEPSVANIEPGVPPLP
jgi:hypothetical protein